MKKVVLLFLFIALVFYSSQGFASIQIIGNVPGSNEKLGNFSGLFSYDSLSDTSAIINLSLKNTSPATNGGYITAFVFNNPSDLITWASLTYTSFASFGLLGLSNNGESASPFGGFDLGASTGGGFLGGGSPGTGIGVGQTGLFTFSLTGTNLDTIDESDFVHELSHKGNPSAAFVARFRGFENEGSDKVPAKLPEPASLILFGLGGIGLSSLRKKYF